MTEKKKRRVSILARIALLFSVAVIISFVLTAILSNRYLKESAANQAKEVAEVAATAVLTSIGTQDSFQSLYTDEEYRDELHDTFRYICQSANIRYLYLYTIENGDSRRYIITAAQDDEEDKKMNTEFGFGSTNTTPLYESELEVLGGDYDGTHQFIDNAYGNVCMFIIPVLDDDDNILAMIGVDYSMESILEIAKENRRSTLLRGVIVIAIAYVIAFTLIRTLVVKPIGKLSKRMEEFAHNKSIEPEQNKRRTVFDDEVTDIEKSFDIMTADITKYITDIEKLTGERVQAKTELEVARNIQFGIVPKERSVSGNGYDAYGCEYSAKDVGGDFYDIFELDDRQICLVEGDVSGKGVSAALFMVMVKTTLKERLNAGASLKDALCSVNRDVCASNPENMFATVFCAVLDKKTGLLRYANAGHNPPVFVKEKPEFMHVDSGIAIGLFDDIDIEEEEVTLKKGEGVFVYTDGITEAINPVKEQYGEERLLGNIAKEYADSNNGVNARKITSCIVDTVREFAGEAEQFDDMTCATLLFEHDEGDKTELTLELASFDSVKKTILNSLGDNEKTRNTILACEEMFANIVFYSGADNVRFSCERVGSTYSVTFSDNGKPFDPVRAKLKEKDFEELDTGGMGIKLARMNSDEMLYNRTDERNVLTMRFKC